MRLVETEHGQTLELNDNDIRYFLSRSYAITSLKLSRAEERLRALRANPSRLPEPEPGTDPLATYCARMRVLNEIPAAEKEVASLRKEEESYRKALGY